MLAALGTKCVEMKAPKGDIKNRGMEAKREEMVSPIIVVEWKGKNEFVQPASCPE